VWNYIFFTKLEPQLRADFGFTPDDHSSHLHRRLATEKNLMFLLQAFAGVAQAWTTCISSLWVATKQIETEIRENHDETQNR